MDQLTNDKQLFPKFQNAVKFLSECCGPKEGCEIPPIARSEVYNETWMLRLTLALLHDNGLKENAPDPLNLLRSAVMRNWISEGGLKPAFDKEGTTWADAILGDVALEDDKSKRGVKVAPVGEYQGVVVVEAKMGSALDSGITNSSNYNQAARNIACLAKLVEGKGNLCDNCAFLVFAPKTKLDEWERKEPVHDLIENAFEVINNQTRNHQWDNKVKFEAAVKAIIQNSKAISWEDVIESINCETGIVYIREFYEATCKEFGITSKF